jgi:putative tryptophan/tyrosine transport system substrate-binding protein
MIARRSLLASVAVFMARPAIAETAARAVRIGMIWAGAARTPEDDPWMRGFLEEMQRLGYTTGKNLAFETRIASGDDKRLADAAAELIALRPDVIFVTATPSLMALAKQHSTVPVVFIVGGDPVQLGVAQSLGHPGGSFTGLFNNAGDVLPKSLQMLRDLLPQARRRI